MGQGGQGSRRQGRVAAVAAVAATRPGSQVALEGAEFARGQCQCGKVRFEIVVPAIWAWHDHSPGTRRAHGAASATYVGTWRKRFRMLAGEKALRHYRELDSDGVRSFCRNCGTPVLYERAKSPHVVNIPRALFDTRTGRDSIYHVGVEQRPDWAYDGGPLVPLPGYPGVLWQPSRRARRHPKKPG